MIKICMFDTKPYDKIYFDELNKEYNFKIEYFETKLNKETAILTSGFDVACAFVNDTIDAETIDILVKNNIKLLAMRCAGYNNIDFKHAYNKIHVVTVPAYSPNAVAEHATALLLTLNRKIHKSYIRVRDHNFSLNGLMGFDIYGKTIGVIGTGRIGRIFINIAKGFGAHVIAHDPFQIENPNFEYVSLDELYQRSDIISIHCPLTKDNYHMIRKESLDKMKDGVIILNTSRGGLINGEDLVDAIRNGKVGGAGLDVYEEEKDFFYEDMSFSIIQDETLTKLIALPNVIITSHQAYFTKEALFAIAKITLKNIDDYFTHNQLPNEICYHCDEKGRCEAKPTSSYR